MELMSGNEAIAQGAWEAGARVGVAYPGTPSTETLEAFALLYVYLLPSGASTRRWRSKWGWARRPPARGCFATMKHVGVNVAADPLFTAAYTGVGGGMVVLAADDPGMYSSQNEQDSHYYARAAQVPMLDPPTPRRRCSSRARPTGFLSVSTCRCSYARPCASRTPRPCGSRGRARRRRTGSTRATRPSGS